LGKMHFYLRKSPQKGKCKFAGVELL